MLTRQMDTLIDQEASLRWLVMQSLKYKKWILAVVPRDFSEYQVTDLMSDNVELIIQYADYLNKGIAGSLIDDRKKALLEETREIYRAFF